MSIEDEQFGEEKQLLIKTLSGLEIKPKAENEAAGRRTYRIVCIIMN